MSTLDGGPAFPIISGGAVMFGAEDDERGLTIRDWFAGMALQGLLAVGHPVRHSKETASDLPPLAYLYADAMITQRKQP